MDLLTLEHRAFATAEEFEVWLEKHHQTADSIVIQFYKKGSGIPSVTYPEAVDIALCYGWIDGQSKSLDSESYVQRFTPRRPKSIWSKINREKIARLQSEGRLKPAGLAEVEKAKADGRWEAAYDSPSTAENPADFQAALEKCPAAKKAFAALNKTNTYSILWKIQTAKRSETRQKRIETIIQDLTGGN
jgi:uncharacterized protein YdeI (YjbR/CyaY-like superfamily)